MTFKVISSTMGRSTPSTVAEDAGRDSGYRWRKIPGWTPGDRRYRDSGGDPPPHNTKAVSAKQQRMARYAECRADGMTREQAAEQVEIGLDTARTYEREIREQQRRAARDG